MKITDLLDVNAIKLNLEVDSKTQLLEKAIELIYQTGNINDKEQFKNEIFKRESISSTGIGEGIAIPHAKCECVNKATISIITLKKPIDYESIDGEDVKILFMLAANDNALHLDVLSKLSKLLLDTNFVSKLIDCEIEEELYELIEAQEVKSEEKHISNNSYKILAVTACPTGIAHTFMAEEALKNACDRKGINIKVETNGSAGTKNELTNEEIKNADVIIVAADKNVYMDRFDGKKVIIVNTSKAIKDSDLLIEQALNGNVKIYKSKNVINNENNSSNESIFRQIYKHLMNGVSHMLPFVIGGGILIAIAFLIDSKNAGSPDFGSVNVVARIFKQIGGYAFSFMLPILSAYIASSIADRPGLAVGFVGGYMATLTDASYIDSVGNASAGFLGALVAGFISGYIVLGLKYITRKLPKSMDGIKPTLIYPLIGILIIGLLMYFVINTPFAYLNNLITNLLNSLSDVSIVILGAVLAGMMAIDMGGPINKAAYVFGTAAITSGNYAIMAPVMIGGMVPPLVIALASTIFPQKFSKKERTDGKVNYIMGLCFITEGAIPFAASDPWRVILSSVIGSSIAGGLCSLFGCTLMAPHGGIFVVAVIGNPLYYLLALAIGTIIGALILGILKENVKDPQLGKFKGLLNKEN